MRFTSVIIFIQVIFIVTTFSQGSLKAAEMGGYTVGQWYTATSDSTVQFRLVQNPSENCVAYQMETTLEAPLKSVLSSIEDYSNYTAHGMPRMTESTILEHYAPDTLDFVMGKQRRTLVSVTDAPVDIVRFTIALDWLPDNHYTLLLTTYRDPETQTVYVYWTQYDEENFSTITGPWKNHVLSPYTKNWIGSTVFDTGKYPKSNDDIYGSWTLRELDGPKTFIQYENYVDPGYWGRKAAESIVKATLGDMPKIIDVVRTHLPK